MKKKVLAILLAGGLILSMLGHAVGFAETEPGKTEDRAGEISVLAGEAAASGIFVDVEVPVMGSAGPGYDHRGGVEFSKDLNDSVRCAAAAEHKYFFTRYIDPAFFNESMKPVMIGVVTIQFSVGCLDDCVDCPEFLCNGGEMI